MAPKKSNPSNPSASVKNFIAKVRQHIKKFWDSLVNPETHKKDVVKRLKTIRSLIVLYAVCFLVMTIAWRVGYYPYVTSTFAVLSAWIVIEEAVMLQATGNGRSDRECFLKNTRRIHRSMGRFLLLMMILAVLAHSNLYGIGEAITNTFPWLGKAISAWITYINEFVREILEMFTNTF